MKRLWRRWRARSWRCRCGQKVFTDDLECKWHEAVRLQVLRGEIRSAEEAR